MSLITIDQFEELSEAYPELAQCYDFTYTTYTSSKDAGEDLIVDSD